MTPQEMHDEVRTSTVLGRGGAGFPAGVKWGFTPKGCGRATSSSTVTSPNRAPTRIACSWSAIRIS